MYKKFGFSVLLSLVLSYSFAQQPSGTWVMAHIKAKQPVLSATMEQGELTFDEGDPYDSSEVYTPGLMVIQFESQRSAISHSWDGNESWQWQLQQDSLLMFGERDTLYGSYSQDQIILSSTVDAVPTEYTFLKVEDKLKLEGVEAKTKAEFKIPDHPFDNLQLTFQQDTVLTEANNIKGLELYLTNIGPLQVIEYTFDRDYSKVELGIVYLFRDKRKKYRGLFYPVVDDFKKPKPQVLEIDLK